MNQDDAVSGSELCTRNASTAAVGIPTAQCAHGLPRRSGKKPYQDRVVLVHRRHDDCVSWPCFLPLTWQRTPQPARLSQSSVIICVVCLLVRTSTRTATAYDDQMARGCWHDPVGRLGGCVLQHAAASGEDGAFRCCKQGGYWGESRGCLEDLRVTSSERGRRTYTATQMTLMTTSMPLPSPPSYLKLHMPSVFSFQKAWVAECMPRRPT